jgi:beta-lactamase superfamily II metal-dependent hydrolase
MRLSKKEKTNTSQDLPPKPDEIEVTLFGRGVGESVLLHFGNGEWMIVDSHIHPDKKEPVALSYLKSLGIDVAKQVKLIVITHWDKDHILGMAEIVAQCKQAEVCLPAAFKEKDFVEFLGVYLDEDEEAGANGHDFSTNEIFKVLQLSINSAKLMGQDRDLYASPSIKNCAVHSLSPVDAEIKDFLAFLGSKIPSEGDTPRRVSDRERNHLSSVLLITIESTTILLGADMMNSNNQERGWSAIINKSVILQKMGNRPSVYKIAHHGAESGDHKEVWDKLLCKNPISVVAPYIAQKEPLPTRKDIMRIERQTNNAYLTSTPYEPSKIEGRHPTAQKFVRDRIPGRNLRCLERGLGHIRLRTKIDTKTKTPNDWKIENLLNAISLADLKKTLRWVSESINN